MWAGVQVEGWLLSFLAALLLALLHYAWLVKQVRDKQVQDKRWFYPFVFRFFATFLLVLLLFGPWLRFTQTQEVKPRILLYVDSTESVDSVDQKAISELAKQLIPKLVKWNAEIKYFGDDVMESNNVGKWMDGNWKKATNFQSVFQDLHKERFKYGLESTVFLTDGIANKGLLPQSLSPPDGLVFSVIGIGDTVQHPDVFVKSVLLNKEIYVGNSGEIEVVVGVKNFSSLVKVTVKVDGEGVSAQTFMPSGSSSVKRLTFPIPRQSATGFKTVRIQAESGKVEKNSSNNLRMETFRVVDAKKLVGLMGDFIDPDMGAIRRAINGYDPLETTMSSAANFDQKGLDALVVLGIPSELGSVKLCSQKFANWLSSGKSLMIVPKREFDLQVINELSSVATLNTSSAWQDAQATLNNDYSGFSLEERLKQRWVKFPPLQCPLQKFTVGDKSKVLLWQRWSGMDTDFPMQWMESVGKGNLMICLGSGFWRWGLFEQKIHGDQEGVQQWVRRSLGVLTSGLGSNKRLEILIGDRQLSAGEFASVRVVSRDVDGALNTDLKPELTLTPVTVLDERSTKTNTHKSGINVALQANEQGFEGNTYPLEAGIYRLNASVRRGKEQITTQEMLVVSNISVERMQTTADLGWLKRAASNAGGFFVYLPQSANLLARNPSAWKKMMEDKSSEIAAQIDKSLVADRVVKELSRNWYWYEVYWILLTIVGLFGLEWAFRKWLGKY